MAIRVRLKSPTGQAVRDKAAALLEERGLLHEQLAVNTRALRDAVAAGRLFGVDVRVPDEVLKDEAAPHPKKPPPANHTPAQPTLFEPSGDASIREHVITELQKAGPRGMKASPLRHIVEKHIGRELHYKTIGMTLYRLSQKGAVRRDGLTWYWVGGVD